MLESNHVKQIINSKVVRHRSERSKRAEHLESIAKIAFTEDFFLIKWRKLLQKLNKVSTDSQRRKV